MEIGSAALNILVECWDGHLTPPEVASLADRASRARDPNMVRAAAELALSCLPHAHALNPNEIQRALVQCKEQVCRMCSTTTDPHVAEHIRHYMYSCRPVTKNCFCVLLEYYLNRCRSSIFHWNLLSRNQRFVVGNSLSSSVCPWSCPCLPPGQCDAGEGLHGSRGSSQGRRCVP